MKHLAALLCLLATPLASHPHIFVNAGIDLLVDSEGRLTHLRVTWEYDELYSLLITEDYGVDSDYDGVLTDADLKLLTGFDMNWVEGFNGDLEMRQDGVEMDLSGPSEATAQLVKGRIITTHLRTVKAVPVILGSNVSLRPFDKTYYTAYEVALPVSIKGHDGCLIEKHAPDIDAALALTQAELAQLPPEVDAEAAGFPEIGARFATEIRVSCPVS